MSSRSPFAFTITSPTRGDTSMPVVVSIVNFEIDVVLVEVDAKKPPP